MTTFTHPIAGETTTINFPRTRDDLGGFFDFLARGDKVLGLDTETTGLGIYEPGFECRLTQFSNRTESWVLETERFTDAIRRALLQDRFYTVHNAAFDLQVIDRTLRVPIEVLGPRVFDTRVMAHLLDPRMPGEGGVGLSLKPLSAVYVDPDAPDTQEGLTKVFNSMKLTKADGFARIPIDHPTYVLYAGLDPILARRLFDEIGPMITGVQLDDLSKFEHHLQLLLAMMQRRGVLVDVPYTEHLVTELEEERERYSAEAARFGVANVNSTVQVGNALEAMGEKLTQRTKTGWKVDKDVLGVLADLDRDWLPIESRTPNPLAFAVMHAKRAGKWKGTYAEAFLAKRDSNDRIHASIGGLQARTARMSISSPPLQQLPSGDWKIRRALIADPGQLIVASDYSQVEMRVLAALCADPALLEAIASGMDLHDYTAKLVFGDAFTKPQRKLAKAIGFGKVYGGGATTIQRQTGANMDLVKEAIGRFDSLYPGIKEYGRRLQRRAEYGRKEVITPSGRHLPLDKDRLYAATNYVVQSTSRDVLAQAIVDVFDAGLGDHLLLPVHDELVAQFPEADAAEGVKELGRIMDGSFFGVEIVSDPEVYGRSWGHGYGAPV